MLIILLKKYLLEYCILFFILKLNCDFLGIALLLPGHSKTAIILADHHSRVRTAFARPAFRSGIFDYNQDIASCVSLTVLRSEIVAGRGGSEHPVY